MMCAGSFQSTCASAGVILGARLTPSADCGTARNVPSSIPSSVATSSCEPDDASRSSSSPLVSAGRIGSVTTPYTGPASIAATRLNVVAPVMSSPCRTACCTGAAPRQAGSSEKCKFTQPCRGTSSADCGSSAPYAVTGQQSGAISRNRSRNTGSRGRAGVSTSSPSDRASVATGDGSTRRPRPAGASGRVTTSATSCLDARSARNEVTATSGVPANTSRMGRPSLGDVLGRVRRDLDLRDGLAVPLGFPDGLHRELALLPVQPVDEQDAVQVVGLVLHAAGAQFGAVDRDRVAEHVEPGGDDTRRARGRVLQTRQRQAPLVVFLRIAGQLEHRVDQVARLIID